MFGEELHVKGSCDTERACQFCRNTLYSADGRNIKRLWRQHERGIAAVYAGVLDMLADCPQNDLALVGDCIDFDLARVALKLGHYNRMVG